jgi:hypothetical protein
MYNNATAILCFNEPRALNEDLWHLCSSANITRTYKNVIRKLVGVQEVRWEGGGTEPVGEYTFFYGKGNENHGLENRVYGRRGSAPLTMRHPSIRKRWH